MELFIKKKKYIQINPSINKDQNVVGNSSVRYGNKYQILSCMCKKYVKG